MVADCDRYVAAVLTVRNEGDILRQNILYHRSLGVGKFFVFLDDANDKSAVSVWDLPYVSVFRSRIPRWFTRSEVPGAARLKAQAPTQHMARQLINAHAAVRQARKEGISWMLSIDADELVLPNDKQVTSRSLADFLHRLSTDVSAVTFPANEVMPRRLDYENVFVQETRFKRRYGFGEGYRENSVRLPYLQEWQPDYLPLEEVIRKMRGYSTLNELFKRRGDTDHWQVIDVPQTWVPLVPQGQIFDWYLGHVLGKQAFRIDRDVSFRSVHKIKSVQGGSINAGRLLHYNSYSYLKFVSKYKAFSLHPNHYAEGTPTDPIKLYFRDLVNGSAGRTLDLRNAFKQIVCFGREKLSALNDSWPRSSIDLPAISEHFKTYLKV